MQWGRCRWNPPCQFSENGNVFNVETKVRLTTNNRIHGYLSLVVAKFILYDLKCMYDHMLYSVVNELSWDEHAVVQACLKYYRVLIFMFELVWLLIESSSNSLTFTHFFLYFCTYRAWATLDLPNMKMFKLVWYHYRTEIFLKDLASRIE